MLAKGNLIIGQSGGPTAVINGSLAGVVSEALNHPQFGEIYGMLDGVQGLLEEKIIDLRTQLNSPAKLEQLKRTPSSALGMCRYKLKPEQFDRLLGILARHNIRYFLYTGGNDSADTCHRLAVTARERGYELYAIGIPKTTDNDLPEMDHTPGYGSVARYTAISTQEASRDTEATCRVHPIKIIEVIGRNAGWLAASAALGKRREEDGPHLIYAPEFSLTTEKFLSDVQQVYATYGYCVAVISEMVKDPEGRVLGAKGDPYLVDSFGHKYFPGPGSYLMGQVIKELGITARFDKPGTFQRSSMSLVSEVDLAEAWQAGVEAVRRIANQESDVMITLLRATTETGAYHCNFGTTPLVNIANTEQKMPVHFFNAAHNFVTQPFYDYALPLIGEELPYHFRFEKSKITVAK